jgi:hypothetical protein
VTHNDCRETKNENTGHETGSSGGSDWPPFLLTAIFVLLIQKILRPGFVEQEAQLIPLILCAAIIRLAFG